jgi:hypothetical protein
MEMIRHERIGVDFELMTRGCFTEYREEDSVVAGTLEYVRPIVAALNHVLRQTSNLEATDARHDGEAMHEPCHLRIEQFTPDSYQSSTSPLVSSPSATTRVVSSHLSVLITGV